MYILLYVDIIYYVIVIIYVCVCVGTLSYFIYYVMHSTNCYIQYSLYNKRQHV